MLMAVLPNDTRNYYFTPQKKSKPNCNIFIFTSV